MSAFRAEPKSAPNAFVEILGDADGAGKILRKELSLDEDLILTRRLSLVCKSWHAALAEEVRRRCAEVAQIIGARARQRSAEPIAMPKLTANKIRAAIKADNLEALNFMYLAATRGESKSILECIATDCGYGPVKLAIKRASVKVFERLLRITRFTEDASTFEMLAPLGKSVEMMEIFERVVGFAHNRILSFEIDAARVTDISLLSDWSRNYEALVWLDKHFTITREDALAHWFGISKFLTDDPRLRDYMEKWAPLPCDFYDAAQEAAKEDKYYEKMLDAIEMHLSLHREVEVSANLIDDIVSAALYSETRSGRCLEWALQKEQLARGAYSEDVWSQYARKVIKYGNEDDLTIILRESKLPFDALFKKVFDSRRPKMMRSYLEHYGQIENLRVKFRARVLDEVLVTITARINRYFIPSDMRNSIKCLYLIDDVFQFGPGDLPDLETQRYAPIICILISHQVHTKAIAWYATRFDRGGFLQSGAPKILERAIREQNASIIKWLKKALNGAYVPTEEDLALHREAFYFIGSDKNPFKTVRTLKAVSDAYYETWGQKLD